MRFSGHEYLKTNLWKNKNCKKVMVVYKVNLKMINKIIAISFNISNILV